MKLASSLRQNYMKINIIILNWNSAEDVCCCVESIINSSFKKFRLIIVDNDSDEYDILKLRTLDEELNRLGFESHLLINCCNAGYAGGNNFGYKYILHNNMDGDLLIVNPDVIFSHATIGSMLNALSSSENISGVMVRTNGLNGTLYDHIKLVGLNQYWLISNKSIS